MPMRLARSMPPRPSACAAWCNHGGINKHCYPAWSRKRMKHKGDKLSSYFLSKLRGKYGFQNASILLSKYPHLLSMKSTNQWNALIRWDCSLPYTTSRSDIQRYNNETHISLLLKSHLRMKCKASLHELKVVSWNTSINHLKIKNIKNNVGKYVLKLKIVTS